MKTLFVQNLWKAYGDFQAIKNASFSLSKGEVVGILGANGAGKSTTLECVLGTRKMDQGIVKILGMDPIRDRNKLFQKVGVQFQDGSYQEKIKVSEICEVTASLYEKSLEWNHLLLEFGLEGKKKSFVSKLSGGLRQRLSIVLALIPDPEVVFLDELTTGLDPRARRDVWKSLLRLKEKGISIVLTSHYMDEVEVLCDRIMILKKGECIFQGRVAEAIAYSPYESLEDAYLWFTEEEENESI